MADHDTNNNNLPLRDDLVKTAMQFLQNPKVYARPFKEKQEFLRRKGLTDNEIQKACELSGTTQSFNASETAIINVPQYNPHPYQINQALAPKLTLFNRVKEYFNAAAVIGAAIYCIYWFYKKFIEKLLFNKKKPDKSKNSDEEAIKKSIKEVKDSILKVEDEMHKLVETRDRTVPQLVQELKQDLASLKGLLLSRKQFPSAPASIPSWQLDSSNPVAEKTSEREDDDAGSGSSTNNSDSSLEMIREDPPK